MNILCGQSYPCRLYPLIINQFIYYMQSLIKKKIALIGGGPVGMFGSLLLEHFGLDYVCLEKLSTPRSHPSAHYISANSKVLLHQIPSLTQKMDALQENWNDFRYYRYVEGIGGRELGKTDHFSPTIEDKIKKSFRFFKQYPSHIPQFQFL